MEVATLPVCPFLRSYVAQANVTTHNQAEPIEYKMLPRIFPNFFIILNEKGDIKCAVNGNEIKLEPLHIYYGGVGTGFASITCVSKIQVITVSIFPYCTPLLFRDDASNFTETCFDISDANFKNSETIIESLAENNNIAHHWNRIQQFFIRKFLAADVNNRKPYVEKAVQLIASSKGTLTIEQLARESFTCVKNIQRGFDQHIGMSPKKISDSIRFNSFVNKFLKFNKTQSLYQTALEYNYYDQAHLNKDFNRFMGISPQAFFNTLQLDTSWSIGNLREADYI